MRIFSRLVLGSIAASLLFASGGAAESSGVSKADEEGRQIAREARAQAPSENTEHTGTLKLRNADGKRSEVPVKLRVIAGSPVWEATYESTAPGQPASKLIIKHDPAGTNQFFLAQSASGPTLLGEPKPIEGDQLFESFAGSDFSPMDLGMDFLHWPQQRLLSREMTKGRSCRKLESSNPVPTAHGYARVISWLDFETGGIIKAEAYDQQNNVVKQFSINGFRKVNGQYELSEIEIRNKSLDSVTRLEFQPSDPVPNSKNR